ncbi:MAG: hypothetical protein ACM3ZA_04125 [Bacillota bacterium]
MRKFLKKPWGKALMLAAVLTFILSGTALASADSVRGDKVTIMGNSEILPDEVVNGDAVTIMGNMDVNGTVTGEAFNLMGNMTINGQVAGDVTVVMGNLTLGPNARVGGQVNVALGQLTRAPGAQSGSVNVDNQRWSYGVDIGNGMYGLAGLSRLAGLTGIPALLAWPFLRPATLFVGWLTGLALVLLMVVLFPGAMKGVGAAAEKEPGKALLMGLLTALVAVPIGILLIITLIGPVVWIVFLVAAGFFGNAAVSVVLGRRVREAVRSPEPGDAGSMAWDAVIGTGVLALVGLIPFLGWLFKALVGLAGLGAVLFSKFGTHRPWFGKAA